MQNNNIKKNVCRTMYAENFIIIIAPLMIKNRKS